MALIACAECGKEISDKAAACPHCGAPVAAVAQAEPPTEKKSGPKLWLWIPLGLVAAFFLFGAVLPKDEAKSRARQVISLCWSDQAKKSNTPGEARFIAGACEKLEADFLAKYKHRP